jgi:hypothetical protein
MHSYAKVTDEICFSAVVHYIKDRSHLITKHGKTITNAEIVHDNTDTS